MFGVAMYDIIFFSIPTALILFFGISLYRYRYAKALNEQEPGSISPKELKTRKTLLIVSSVMAAVLAAVVIGFIALLFGAVAFM